LDGRAVPVLRILNQENHWEGNDCRSCIDNQLPGIEKVKQRARYRPDANNACGKHEGQCPAGCLRRLVRNVAKYPA
jgi:hypothetical protein